MSRFLIACVAGLSLVGLGRAAGPVPQKYALLVGCTEYPNDPGIPPLRGPTNDVQMWAQLLTDRNGFAFPEKNVTRLVGWPEQEKLRPTRQNIVAGFEALIGAAGPGAQIVVVLSGHGTQCPIPDTQDPLDPKNPEPDGLDEVFLPADSKKTDGFPANGIKDDEIGGWLDALREKGASVFIVFDCCHSGTMTRGTADDRETPRTVLPTHFYPPQVIDDAIRRAAAAVAAAPRAGRLPAAPREEIKPSAPAAGTGGVVAFYAAQPYETAPELPLPEGKANVPEHIRGMLSYSLGTALERRQSRLTYRDLARLVAATYRANRGTGPPTPFAEGDLDREVLGLNKWPERSAVVISPADGRWQASAGSLRGLTVGAVLAVRRPAGAAGDPDEVVAHVRVASVSVADAVVVPVEHAGRPAVSADKLPAGGRCEVVSRDFGDMRVKVFADGHTVLRAGLDGLDETARELVARVDAEAAAEWVLRVVTADRAAAEFGLAGLRGDHALLVRGEGRKAPADDKARAAELQAARRAVDAGRVSPNKVFAAYPLDDPKALAGLLSTDLSKAFRWQNLWRLSGQAGGGANTSDVRFEIRMRTSPTDQTGETIRGAEVASGSPLLLCLDNDGLEEVWVAVFYADANLGIKQVYAGLVDWRPAGKVVRVPFRLSSKGGGDGVEGMVVVMIPKSAQPTAPDLTALEQSSFKVRDRGWKGFGVPKTPFERLLKATAGSGQRGDFQFEVKTTPAMTSQTWVLLPEKK